MLAPGQEVPRLSNQLLQIWSGGGRGEATGGNQRSQSGVRPRVIQHVLGVWLLNPLSISLLTHLFKAFFI